MKPISDQRVDSERGGSDSQCQTNGNELILVSIMKATKYMLALESSGSTLAATLLNLASNGSMAWSEAARPVRFAIRLIFVGGVGYYASRRGSRSSRMRSCRRVPRASGVSA